MNYPTYEMIKLRT